MLCLTGMTGMAARCLGAAAGQSWRQPTMYGCRKSCCSRQLWQRSFLIFWILCAAGQRSVIWHRRTATRSWQHGPGLAITRGRATCIARHRSSVGIMMVTFPTRLTACCHCPGSAPIPPGPSRQWHSAARRWSSMAISSGYSPGSMPYLHRCRPPKRTLARPMQRSTRGCARPTFRKR